MDRSKRIRIRSKRLQVEKRHDLEKLFSTICELLEQQFKQDQLSMQLELLHVPKFICIDEKKLLYLFHYIIEIFLSNIGLDSALSLQVTKNGPQQSLHIVFIEKERTTSASLHSKLMEILNEVTSQKAKKSFSYELANDLVEEMGGKLWLEHSDERPTSVHILLKL